MERLARVPPLGANQVDRLCRGVSETIQASMFGMMAVALAQAVLQGTGFWFLGVPGPVLWGTVTVFASLLPVIGAASVWIPAAVWLFLAGSWVKGIVLIAWGVGVVGMADNLLRPYVMSGKVAMHPLILFFALMGGVQAFGMIGLFAGPVIVAVTQTLFELLAEELRGRGILAAKEDAPG
jgi:predicted PurR-regulated permease PerM